MKKILYAISAMALLLCACSKDDKDPAPIDKVTEEEYWPSKIYEETGCNPTNVEDIKTYKLYKDTDNTKYLYGSKYKDGEESFWFAQYNSSGEQQWEIVHKDNQFASHAYGPVQIGNGNIVVNNVTEKDAFTICGASPVIIDKEGKANYINVFNGYYYTDVYTFEKFFFCDINDFELNKTSSKEWCTQISNEGKILNQGENLNIPNGEFAWLGDNYFIEASNEKIVRKGVLLDADSTWAFIPKNTHGKLENPQIIIENDSVVINYNLLQEGNDVIKSYKLSCATGFVSETGDIEEFINANVNGSIVSIDGFVTGDVIAAFYNNNSSKIVEVTEFTMYETGTNKVVYQQKDCGFVEYKKPLQYELKFSMVYKPLFVWKYTSSGKSYEASYQM